MTWSKVLSFIINLIGTSLISFALSKGTWDVKIAGSVYAAYILVYMLISDWLSSSDKGTSSSKCKAELESAKELITVYEACMLDAHHCALGCITNKTKGATLNYELNFIITTLSEVRYNATNKGNEYKYKAVQGKPAVDAVGEFIVK